MANLKFYGELIEVLQPENGQTRDGKEWFSQGFILEELNTKYPKKARFVLYSDALKEDNVSKMTLGNDVTMNFDIFMRDWIGQDGKRKFATELRAWRVDQGDTIEQTKPKQDNGNTTPIFAKPNEELF